MTISFCLLIVTITAIASGICGFLAASVLNRKKLKLLRIPVPEHIELEKPEWFAKPVMAETERNLYDLITETLGSEHMVLPRVSLRACLGTTIQTGASKSFGATLNKSCAFLICDKKTSKVLAGIDIEGAQSEEITFPGGPSTKDILEKTGIRYLTINPALVDKDEMLNIFESIKPKPQKKNSFQLTLTKKTAA